MKLNVNKDDNNNNNYYYFSNEIMKTPSILVRLKKTPVAFLQHTPYEGYHLTQKSSSYCVLHSKAAKGLRDLAEGTSRG